MCPRPAVHRHAADGAGPAEASLAGANPARDRNAP